LKLELTHKPNGEHSQPHYAAEEQQLATRSTRYSPTEMVKEDLV